jgi:hypothetical protein
MANDTPRSSSPPNTGWTAQDQRECDRMLEVMERTYELRDSIESVSDLGIAIRILEVERRHRTLKPDGYIYILKAGGYYKLGRSKKPDRRIKALSIQLPFPVEVVCVIPCEDHVAAEQWFHWLYSDRRANGEWFVLDPDAVSLLQSVRAIVYKPGDDCPSYRCEQLDGV